MLVIVIVFMAVTSSGASEMVAVSSLFTFDVYRRYINPKVCPFVIQGPSLTRCRLQPAEVERVTATKYILLVKTELPPKSLCSKCMFCMCLKARAHCTLLR